MAKPSYTTLFSSLLLTGLVLFFNKAVFADDVPVTVTLEAVTDNITAGEQVELALTIRYHEGFKIVFDPEAQELGTMELLSSQVAPLYWSDGYWQYTIYMDATFLTPEQHWLPAFSVDLFSGSGFWQLRTESRPVNVLSAFEEQPVNVQSTIRLDSPEQAASPIENAHISWLLLALLSLITAGIIRRRKGIPEACASVTSAADFAVKARDTGLIDWDGLGQWLMVATGSDPTGQLTANEPLLYRYQELRFSKGHSSEGDIEAFVEYCNQCQEKWG